jgi:ketosteroid isomerase-like protein
MRIALGSVMALCLLLGADAPQDGSVKEVEKALRALNEAFKKRDAEAIQRLMMDTHVAITPYYGGPATRADQLKALPDLKMTEYKPGEMKITLVNKDTALVTYPLTQMGTYKGKELPAKSYASAVWVQQGGKWLEAFYQETALPAK